MVDAYSILRSNLETLRRDFAARSKDQTYSAARRSAYADIADRLQALLERAAA